jgi:hypothetical protein
VSEQGLPGVNPLVNLPSLRFLFLYIPHLGAHGEGWLLHGLSGVSSLRSLLLDNDSVQQAEQVSVLSQVTQLTCLWLTRLYWCPQRDGVAMCSSMSQINNNNNNITACPPMVSVPP